MSLACIQDIPWFILDISWNNFISLNAASPQIYPISSRLSAANSCQFSESCYAAFEDNIVFLATATWKMGLNVVEKFLWIYIFFYGHLSIVIANFFLLFAPQGPLHAFVINIDYFRKKLISNPNKHVWVWKHKELFGQGKKSLLSFVEDIL